METPVKHPKTAALFTALLAALDISASKLAKAISSPDEEYSQQVISNYVSGKFKPGQEVLGAIARRYPAIDAKWLLTGEGLPFPAGRYNEKPTTPTEPDPPMPPARSNRAQVVEHADTVLKLSEVEQQLVETARELASKDAENQQLAERLKDAKEEILWLRGKSFPSSYAADPTPRMEISGMRPTACQPTAEIGGKVVDLLTYFAKPTGPVMEVLAADGEVSKMQAA